MAKSKESFTCVDIGSSSIKLLVGEWASGKVSLKKVIVLPFKKELISGLDESTKFKILSDLLVKEKIKGTAILCYATFGKVSQTISVAPMPYEEIREAVRWDIIQKKQLDPLSVIFDFIVSDKTYDESSDQKEVYLTYNNKKDISHLEKIFSARKINLLAIENPNFALIHALIKLKTISTDNAYLILDFGSSFLRFIIVQKKQIIFERDLDFGGNILTKNIVDACKLKLEDAEKDKKEYGVSVAVTDEKIIEEQKNLQSSLDNMISKILYSMKYFSYQVTKSKITSYEKVLLTGGGATLKGIKELVGKNVACECEVVDFSDLVKLPGNFDMKGSNNIWPTLNAAIGLGFWNKGELNKFCTSVITNSISSRDHSSKLSGMFKSKYSTIFIFILLTIAMCGFGLFNLDRIRVSIGKIKNRNIIAKKIFTDKEFQMNQNKLELKSLKEDVGFLKSKMIDAKNKISAFNIYQNQAHYTSEIFEIVSRIRPSDLYVTSINVGEFMIRITGVSKSHKMISSFMKTLNNSKLLKNCKFVFAKNKNSTVFIEFEIDAEKIL